MTKVSSARTIDYSESTWITQTGTYTVQLSNAANIIAVDATSSTPLLSVVIPNNNFPRGFSFSIIRLNTRRVTLAPGPGVVFKTPATSFELTLTNSIGSVVYSGTPATGWILFGDYL